MNPREIFPYKSLDGHVPFEEWYSSIFDKRVTSRIMARIDRAALGHYGDFKNVGMGVFEMRLHFGSGYRIYFGLDRNTLIILLLGGDKSSQDTDIQKAQIFWQDYLRRKK